MLTQLSSCLNYFAVVLPDLQILPLDGEKTGMGDLDVLLAPPSLPSPVKGGRIRNHARVSSFVRSRTLVTDSMRRTDAMI